MHMQYKYKKYKYKSKNTNTKWLSESICTRSNNKVMQIQNTNMQIHKYTNTAYDEVPERPNVWYIFEKSIVQRYEKWYSCVSNAQIQKYKYTNTQIQHMTKCQKDPACGIIQLQYSVCVNWALWNVAKVLKTFAQKFTQVYLVEFKVKHRVTLSASLAVKNVLKTCLLDFSRILKILWNISMYTCLP